MGYAERGRIDVDRKDRFWPVDDAERMMNSTTGAVARLWLERLSKERNLAAIEELHSPRFFDHSSRGQGTDRAANLKGIVALFATVHAFGRRPKTW